MSDEGGMWKTGELLAYTEREGPGRPPSASPTWMMGTLIGVLGVTFVGLMASDTLCPEHRAWVEVLAGAGFFAIVGSLVALVRGSAVAPLLALAASSLGLAIGVLDAAHSPTRGRLVAVGFGVALALAAMVSLRAARLHRWDREVAADLRPVGLEWPAGVTSSDASAPVASPAASVIEVVDVEESAARTADT